MVSFLEDDVEPQETMRETRTTEEKAIVLLAVCRYTPPPPFSKGLQERHGPQTHRFQITTV